VTPDELPAEIEAVATRLDARRKSAGVFWIDLHGPVPAAPGPDKAAAAVYGRTSLVTGLDPLDGHWAEVFTRTARSMAAFDGLFPTRGARAEPESLLDRTVLLIEEALGPVRSAWLVHHQPSSWYAALWTDHLLVTDEWAAVLSLTRDS